MRSYHFAKAHDNVMTCLLFVGLSLVYPPTTRGEEIFTDITADAGVRGLGIGGHGLGIGDINGDGLLDIYVTNSFEGDPLINHLFLNNGDNIFEDIAVEVEVDDIENLGGHGVVLTDIDNDQDVDIFIGNMGVAGIGPNRNTLFRNEGDLTFVDISLSSGIGDESNRTRGVAALDIDSDGDLDLISSPFQHPITLYLNDGTGKFTSEIRGIEDDNRAKQGLSAVDIERDGDVDLYVNKWGESPNRLFLNDGRGFFVESAESFGVDSFKPENNGATFADMDNDGDLDLFIMNKTQSGALLQVFRYENGRYADETRVHDIIGDGFSVTTGDVDNDGDIDLFVPRAFQRFALYLNDGNGHFTESPGSGIEVIGKDTRASSFADFDNDGDLDLMVVQKGGYIYLFRNETNNDRFIEIRLIGPTGEKYAMGAKAELFVAGHAGEDAFRLGYREISSAMSYISQVSPVLHFGLYEASRSDLLLSFPTGEEILLRDIPPGTILDVDARNEPPPDFNLLSPTPTDTVMADPIILDWEDTDDPNMWDTVFYDIHYGTSQVFHPSSTYVEKGLIESEFALHMGHLTERMGRMGGVPQKDVANRVLEAETFDDLMIHWKVRAYDTQGDTTNSSPEQSNFWTSIPDMPVPFSLLSPLDGDTIGVGDSILFVWEESDDPDPYDSLLTYHLNVGRDSTLSDTVWTASTFGDTFFVATPFDEPMTVYWNVVAEGLDGLDVPASSVFRCHVVNRVGIENGDDAAGPLPRVFALSQNYPNPFNPSTTFRIEVPRRDDPIPANTALRIYNLRGKRVRTLLDRPLGPGVHYVVWDGLDDRHSMTPSGIYIAVLDNGEERRKVKMVLDK